MDMGDILNQWDSMQKNQLKKQKENNKNQTSHKKANAPTPEEKAQASKASQSGQPRINPMELWLRRYGTVDKDKIAEEQESRSKLYDRNYLLSMKPEAYLDLHGLHQDEAQQSLDRFITDCKARGYRKVLIIHGKGIHSSGSDPVLGELVRRFIEHDKRCGTSGHPKTKAEGGTGATWVLLK